MKKRLISLLLAFSMMLTFLPAGAVSAFAEEPIDPSKGTLLHGDETISRGGTYSLSGNYTKAIKINTSESVIINIAAGDEVTFQPEGNAGPNVLLDVVTNSDLTVNNNGVYNGPTFLYISTNSANAKVTINGGRYNITKQPNVETCAFDFEVGGSDENPIVVDGVYIETGLDCTGIEACGAPKVMIKNSTINVLDTGYTGGGAINIVDSRVDRDPLVILENVTAHAPKSATIRINGGNLIINSGHYTSDRSSVVSIYGDYNYTTAVPTVEIHGGEFIGSGSQSPTLAVYKTNGTMKIHGGTFTSTKCGQVLGNKAHVTIDGTPEFNSVGGTADAIVNVDGGQMEFNDGIIKVSGGLGRAALRADGTSYNNKTEINGGKIIGAKYGIQVRNGKPNVILGDVQFENNNTDIYLNKNQKITIEKTFNHNATVDCADPKDGRQLTTSTTGTDYQKNLSLTSANKDYLVSYKKTEDGQEYRCLSKKVGVTISGLDGDIKAEDPAEFTVTLSHAGSTGNGILTFGSKNGEIEYQDETGAYQHMQESGLEIGLGDAAKNLYTFRITPQNAGDQELTAAVERDAVELGTKSKGYHVEGRVPTAVTIEGLEDAVIKEGESKDFTVTVTPNDDAKLGEAFIDFGDKNGEIEYRDENGVYHLMPEGGLPIRLGDGEKPYAFRITPKTPGQQTLTAVVKQGEKELASDTTNLTGTKTLSVTGGTATVEKDGRTLNIVPVVTGDKKTYSIPEDNVKVTVTLDKTQIPEGMVFDIWTTGSFLLPSDQNYKAETITFTMNENVDIAAQYRDATIEDDGSTVLGTAAVIGTAVVGTMVLGYQAYSLGTEFAGYLMDLPYFPANRSALAVMLWEDAGKPMPESELLYPDVGQEEQDMDLQHAARWAMENDLIPDRNEEGTAPEEMKFYPDNAVSRIDVLKAWQKAQELKKNA